MKTTLMVLLFWAILLLLESAPFKTAVKKYTGELPEYWAYKAGQKTRRLFFGDSKTK